MRRYFGRPFGFAAAFIGLGLGGLAYIQGASMYERGPEPQNLAGAVRTVSASGSRAERQGTVVPANSGWSWKSSCEVKCANGECKAVCGSGILFADSETQARTQAELAARAEAGKEGIVISVSINFLKKL